MALEIIRVSRLPDCRATPAHRLPNGSSQINVLLFLFITVLFCQTLPCPDSYRDSTLEGLFIFWLNADFNFPVLETRQTCPVAG